METRKIREFERLLWRTQHLEDREIVKSNMIIVEERLTELRNSGAVDSAQVSKYFSVISEINKKLTESKKTATPRKQIMTISEEETKTISEEREKHKELTSEYLKLTESLKEKVALVGDEMRKDSEIVENAHKGIDKTLNIADEAHVELDSNIKSLWSMKEWKWLAQVILVFLLMQIVFL